MEKFTNIQAEEAILGGVLVDPTAMARIFHLVKTEYFSSHSHRIIWETIAALFRDAKSHDLTSVTLELGNKNLLPQVGGVMTITSLIEQTVSAVAIDRYVELLKEKFQRRELQRVANLAISRAEDLTAEIGGSITTSQQDLFDIALGSEENTGPQLAVDIGSANIIALSEGKSPVIPTGFKDLDGFNGGLTPGDLVVVAARPSMGKTSFALNIALQVDVPVVIFSLEVTKSKTVAKLQSTLSGCLGANAIINRCVPDHHINALLDAQSQLGERTILVDDRAVNPTEMAVISRQFKAQLKERGNDGIIIVDYIQEMECKGQNATEELAEIARKLKQLAKELNWSVIAISQLNRGVESRNDKRPILSDLRGSGGIEQAADMIFLLYRDAYYREEKGDPTKDDICEVNVAKNRNGSTGMFKLWFQPLTTTFKNMTAHSYDRDDDYGDDYA